MGEIATHPALLDLNQQASMGPRLQRLYHLVEQVRSRGEIRHEASLEVVADMIAGPLCYHLVLTQPLGGGSQPADVLEQLADAALYGIPSSNHAQSPR